VGVVIVMHLNYHWEQFWAQQPNWTETGVFNYRERKWPWEENLDPKS